MAAESEKKKQSKFVKFFSRIGKFFREIKSEIKKITWPAPKTVTRNTIVTLIAIAVIGIFVFALDFGLNRLLSLIMGVSSIV